MVAVQPKHVFSDRLSDVAGQIKINMVGWIKQGRLIACSFSGHPPNVLFRQCVANLYVQVAGKTVLAVRTATGEDY